MASEYTPNRRYPLYTDQDKPNLRDQYNGAINTIDTDMKQALDDSSAVSNALGAGFDAQHTVRMAIDSANTAISSESTARQNADTSLSTAISDEVTARQNADTSLSTAISDEVTARQNADTSLSTAISDEVTARQTAISDEVTARQTADTSLGASITSLGTAVTDETTARQQADTALNNRLTIVESTYFAVIGDSFSDQTSEWPNIVASKTGYGLINKAAGGAGFAPAANTSIPTFLQQLNTLKNDANFNKVKHVLVYGGVNDWSDRNHTATQTIAYVDAFIASWESISGIKPKLTFVFGNAGAPERSFNRTYFGYPRYVKDVCAHIREAGYDAIEAFPFLMGYLPASVFNNDNLHPNSTGEAVIASYMTQILNGTYNGVHKQFIKSVNGTNFDVHSRLNIDGLTWTLEYEFKAAQQLTITTTWIEIISGLPHVTFGIPSHDWAARESATQMAELVIDSRTVNYSVSQAKLIIPEVGFNTQIGNMYIHVNPTFSGELGVISGFVFDQWFNRFSGEIV